MARIFIAIRFNDEFKRKIVEIQDSLKSRGVETTDAPEREAWKPMHFIR